MKTKTAVFSCFVSLTVFFSAEAAEIIQTNSGSALDATCTEFVNSFVWGQPINNLSLGITYLNPSNRSGEKSDVLVCLLDVGPTNITWWRWMGPPQFQRVELYLYDSSGRVVPYLATYHPANKIYKILSEVPKNVHNVRIGHIIPSREFPVPYERIALTNIFQIEHGGDYKLVARGRIMKINDDSSLSIIEFPPISLPIHWDKKSEP